LKFASSLWKSKSSSDADDNSESTNSSHPELAFFNNLSATLDIELTIDPSPIGKSYVMHVSPDAKIKSLKLEARVYVEASQDFRDLTEEEMDSVAFIGSSITLRSESEQPITHRAPNGRYFTVKQLLQAVEDTERHSRPHAKWFGGIDVHHVFMEGLEEGDDQTWTVVWGS